MAATVLAVVAGAAGPAVGAQPPAPNGNLPPAFASWENYWLGSWAKSVVIGDFTGDGRQDVVMGTGQYFDPLDDNKLFLYPQTAAGTLNRPIRLDTDADGVDEEMATAAGDLDGDGRTDLVLATLAGVDIFLQRSGGLVRTQLVAVPGSQEVSLADFDGDGDLDLVVDRLGGLVVLTGTGTGTFGPSARVNDVDYKEMETGDVTGDGQVDIVGLKGNLVDVMAGRGDGTFDDPLLYKLNDRFNMSQGIALGDFNGDGRTDAAVSIGGNTPGSMVELMLQTPAGTFARPTLITA